MTGAPDAPSAEHLPATAGHRPAPAGPGAAPCPYVFVGIVSPAPSADSFGSGQRADIVLILV